MTIYVRNKKKLRRDDCAYTRLSAWEWDGAWKVAAAEGRALASYIRKLVREDLERHGIRRPDVVKRSLENRHITITVKDADGKSILSRIVDALRD